MRWFKSNSDLSFNNKLIMYVADTLGCKPLHNEVTLIRKFPLLGGTYRRAIELQSIQWSGSIPECISVIIIEQVFQRLEEVKNKSRVFSDYDNSLLVRLLVPFQPRKIRNYQVGNGSSKSGKRTRIRDF